MTVEEAYLFVRYLLGIDPSARIGVGFIPTEGREEVFPSGFTIRPEKCPNRRGVERVVQGLTGQFSDYAAWRRSVEADPPGAGWMTGGYPRGWSGEDDAQAIAAVPLRIVQDLFPGPVWLAANFRLPSVAWAERAGSYVNAQDRLQSFEWAVRPPRGVLSEGQLLWRLSGRKGLYQARDVLIDVVRDIGYFAAASRMDVPQVGIDLKANQLVGSSAT
jgi:NADH-quinone oxidoreductase subunit G